jgi:tetratricopeptide (TPR) repeat protein
MSYRIRGLVLTAKAMVASALMLSACQASSSSGGGGKGLFGSAFGQLFAAAPPRNSPNTPSRAFRRADCYLPPFPAARGAPDLDVIDSRAELEQIAAYCLQPPPQRDARFTESLANSYFHAGKARRMAGDLETAAQNLQTTISLLGPNSSSPVRNSALLELSRTYRLLRRPGGEEFANALPSDRPEVRFERAMWILVRIDQRPAQTAEQDAARRSQRLIALDHLRAFRSPVLTSDRFVGTQGPAALAELANDLGEEALASTMTEDNALLARDRLEDAAGAIDQLHGGDWDRQAIHINVNLGRAHLRLAGLQRGPENTNVECGLGVDRQSAEALRAAAGSFERAQARNPNAPEAIWGLGCVRMALGDVNGAIAEFQRASQLAPVATVTGPWTYVLQPWDYQIALGHAYERDDPQRAIDSFNAALRGQPGPDGASQRRIHLAMAQLFVGRGQTIEALGSIGSAVGADPRDFDPARDSSPNAEAYLLRARLLRGMSDYDLGRVGLSRLGSRDLARLNLRRATAIGTDQRGAAYRELSLLEVDQGRVHDAVRAMDDAVVADRSQPDYRRQACLMRITHWQRLANDQALRERGAIHCVANLSDNSTNDAEQLFYEGLFHLRGSYPPARGGDQSRAWANALDAFTRGLDRLGDPGADERRQRIRALLAHGQNNTLYCGGFGGATGSVAAPRSEGAMGEWARQEFITTFAIETCAQRRA